MTPLAINWPVTKAIFVTEVNMPLSAIGQTSEAYAGATTTYVPSICYQSVKTQSPFIPEATIPVRPAVLQPKAQAAISQRTV